MPAKATRKPRKPDPAKARERVLDTALRLAAERPWDRVSLPDLAAAADLSLADLYALYPTRQSILRAIIARTDQRVLDETPPPGEGESVRDRLFDILMRRFDALSEHRAGILSMARATARDPLAALTTVPSTMRSMAWMLEAAGVPAAGPCGGLRVKGLAAVYAAAFRTWAGDDSPDMARTMAAVDRFLARAEKLSAACARRGPGRAASDAPVAEAEAG
ncbi:MAG: TetR family transcriptional regulator [Hyphomicrobiales bacterium]|nr:TetR family transcriptional regulator [Hyphomicrobiales bacterium]MCP5372328.1 TetR family transcriptional regulator [Hyphomicrobiales bacterium]